MAGYPHDDIEPRWQAYWRDHGTFRQPGPGDDGFDADKPGFYALDMFPYPSGAGLHVGHPEGYTATDIVARVRRMQGYNVLHPMGWDAFGLPAEQAAIKEGIHPRVTTERNVAEFRRQLQRLGFSYDWSREVNTTDPDYVRWTQHIFLVLYERGLAYESFAPVNWCPALGAVLSNEEVVDGRSEIGGHPVEQRPMRQWMLRITEYADRLLDGLDGLDWPESVKAMQRNWIGRSTGAEVDFQVFGFPALQIEAFTTRPDTLFGATYMVLAPEHPLVDEITAPDQAQAVRQYVEATARKTERDRMEEKAKTGVFTGAHAVNPANGQKVPVWIADYVLAGYGTGAIMAVPAHDARDFEFARVHGLPVRPVVRPPDAWLAAHAGPDVPTDTEADLMFGRYNDAPEGWTEVYTGDQGTLMNSDASGGPVGRIADQGVRLDGLRVPAATAAMTAWLEQNGAGRQRTTYKLRDWLFSRQRYWGEPIPVVHTADGARRCPTARCRCGCPRSPATSPRRRARARSPRRPTGSRRRTPKRASRRSARPTPCRSGPARAGTTSATSTPTTPTGWWTRPRRRTGCPSTSTSAAPSTPSCTCSTPGSGTRCCSTPGWSPPTSRSRSW